MRPLFFVNADRTTVLLPAGFGLLLPSFAALAYPPARSESVTPPDRTRTDPIDRVSTSPAAVVQTSARTNGSLPRSRRGIDPIVSSLNSEVVRCQRNLDVRAWRGRDSRSLCGKGSRVHPFPRPRRTRRRDLRNRLPEDPMGSSGTSRGPLCRATVSAAACRAVPTLMYPKL